MGGATQAITILIKSSVVSEDKEVKREGRAAMGEWRSDRHSDAGSHSHRSACRLSKTDGRSLLEMEAATSFGSILDD